MKADLRPYNSVESAINHPVRCDDKQHHAHIVDLAVGSEGLELRCMTNQLYFIVSMLRMNPSLRYFLAHTLVHGRRSLV